MQELYTAEMAHRAAQQAITMAEQNQKDINELKEIIAYLIKVLTQLVTMVN